jgi:hypothetical protein
MNNPDGIGLKDLLKVRERALEEVEKEERRQQAQFEFGLRAEPPQPTY